MNELTKEVSRKVMGGSIGRKTTFEVDFSHIMRDGYSFVLLRSFWFICQGGYMIFLPECFVWGIYMVLDVEDIIQGYFMVSHGQAMS